jgi:hypothetical protein
MAKAVTGIFFANPSLSVCPLAGKIRIRHDQ